MIFLMIAVIALAFAALGFVVGSRNRKASAAFQQGVVVSNTVAIHRPAKKRLKLMLISGVAMFLIFIMPLAVMPQAEAALSDTMRTVFETELKNFVVGIMSDTTNEVYTWSWMLFTFLAFLLVVREVFVFVVDGVDLASHLEAVIFFFITLALMGFYDSFTSNIWGVGVGVSNGFQKYLVGNTDNFFLSQWIHKSMTAIQLEELSLWDSLKLIGYSVQWRVMAVLLDVVAWLATMWAEFGYALAKVVGLVFIPFLMLPATRSFFDGWFKFFVGFVVLVIMLKGTLVIAAITVKAILGTLGVTWDSSYGEPSSVVIVAKENLYLLADASAMLFISVLFVLSSFVFAAIIGGGGNVSAGVGRVAKKAINRVLR